MVTFDIIWNPTGDDAGKGFWANLSDVISQKANEDRAIMTLDDFTDYWINENNLPDYSKDSQEYLTLKNQISTKYFEQLNQSAGVNFQQIVSEFNGIVPTPFRSVVELLQNKSINKLEEPKLVGRNYVLLIPHSQGNIYANSLYTYITSIEKFSPDQVAIYGIASPTNSNLGSGIIDYLKLGERTVETSCGSSTFIPYSGEDSYITSSNDFVIGGARVLFNKYPSNIILPSNSMADFSMTDVKGHSLIDIYLTDKKTSTLILRNLMTQLGYFVAQTDL